MPLQETGRIAFRAEGESWNAYWAPEQTSMSGALLLGSLRMSLAQRPHLKAEFMALMRLSFEAVAEDAFGQPLIWKEPRSAPENERSGNA